MDMDDKRYVLAFLMVMIAVFCVVLLGAGVSCANTGRAMGFESSFSLTTHCLIKVDGRWVPLDSYKVIQ